MENVVTKREKLVCDQRSGCVAIYVESRKDETNGCHHDDDRNIAYSCKGSYMETKVGWTMDQEIQDLFQDMVDAYNEKYGL